MADNFTASSGASVSTASRQQADLAHRTKVEASTATGSVSANELTRPANATAYAVGDVINDSVTAPTIGELAAVSQEPSNAVYLTGLQLQTDQKTCVAQIRVHFWSTNAPTIPVDNAVFSLLYAEKATYLGFVDLPNLQTEDATGSTSAIAFDDTIRKRLVTDSNKKVYFQLQTKTAFTPASGQKFYLTATVEKN